MQGHPVNELSLETRVFRNHLPPPPGIDEQLRLLDGCQLDLYPVPQRFRESRKDLFKHFPTLFIELAPR